MSQIIRKNGESVVVVRREKSVDTIMADAVGILAAQIEHLRIKSRDQLNEKDVKALHSLITSLTMLSREEREREKADELSERLKNMSDAELLAYASEKLNAAK